MIFNPPRNSTSGSACTKAVAEGSRQGAPGEVFMAICRDERALGYGWGILGDLGPLEAERDRLAGFLLIMAMDILPDRNFLRDGNCILFC